MSDIEQAPKQSFLKKWLPLLVLSLALFMIVLDSTLLNVSLKNVTEDLNSSIQNIQWVISAYALVTASLTITGGRLGDIFGRKKMFILGAIIFALGSLTASFSHSFAHLLVGESIMEGVGAALMMPATSSLLLSNYRGRERSIAFGVWGGIAAVGASVGPIIGGFLTTNYGWQWGFRINVFVTILLLIGSVIIKDSKDHQTDSSYVDIGGAALSSLGLFSLIFAVIESTTYGWWIAKTPLTINGSVVGIGSLSIVPIAILLGLIFLTAFYFWEKRIVANGKPPIINMKIFRNKQFSFGVLATTTSGIGMTGLIFALPIFLQAVLGLDAFHTGLALLPLSIAILVASGMSGGFLSKYIAPRTIILVSRLVTAAGLMVLAFSLHVDSTVAHLAPGLILFGFGGGLAMAQLSNVTLSAISVNQSGEASGINSTVRRIGSSLGSSILGAFILTTIISGVSTNIQTNKQIPQNLKPAISQSLQKAGTNVEFGAMANNNNGKLPTSIQTAVSDVVKQATVEGSRKTILWTTTFVGLSFLLALGLPKGKDIELNESLETSAAR